MTKIFAHRGFSGVYPENTLLSFRKALEAGCDGIELDVHLTRDGELAVMHDERVDRTTGASGELRSYTMDELRRLDAGRVKPGQFPFEPVPSLRDYFELVKDSPIVTNIELKNSVIRYEGMEEKVIALVREYGLSDRMIFSSFNHESVALCRELAPDIPCGFLYDCWLLEPGKYAKKHGVRYLHPSFSSLRDRTIEEIHREGVGLNVWTVNDPDVMRFLAKNGVNGIITNYPDKCREVLAGLSSAEGIAE